MEPWSPYDGVAWGHGDVVHRRHRHSEPKVGRHAAAEPVQGSTDPRPVGRDYGDRPFRCRGGSLRYSPERSLLEVCVGLAITRLPVRLLPTAAAMRVPVRSRGDPGPPFAQHLNAFDNEAESLSGGLHGLHRPQIWAAEYALRGVRNNNRRQRFRFGLTPICQRPVGIIGSVNRGWQRRRVTNQKESSHLGHGTAVGPVACHAPSPRLSRVRRADVAGGRGRRCSSATGRSSTTSPPPRQARREDRRGIGRGAAQPDGQGAVDSLRPRRSSPTRAPPRTQTNVCLTGSAPMDPARSTPFRQERAADVIPVAV